jgi:hypothetical protein
MIQAFQAGFIQPALSLLLVVQREPGRRLSLANSVCAYLIGLQDFPRCISDCLCLVVVGFPPTSSSAAGGQPGMAEGTGPDRTLVDLGPGSQVPFETGNRGPELACPRNLKARSRWSRRLSGSFALHQARLTRQGVRAAMVLRLRRRVLEGRLLCPCRRSGCACAGRSDTLRSHCATCHVAAGVR